MNKMNAMALCFCSLHLYIYIFFFYENVFITNFEFKELVFADHFVEHAEINIVMSTWTSGKSLGFRNSRLETLGRSGSRLHEARQTPVWTTW